MDSNEVLPVDTSILRSLFTIEALARWLEAAYALTNVRCQLIKGTINDVYRVDSSQCTFILRIHRAYQHSQAELAAELDILDELITQGFRVTSAVRRPTGERWITIPAPEGPRYGVLFTFISGQLLSKQPERHIVRLLGRTIAQLHQAATNFAFVQHRPCFDFALMVESALDALKPVLIRPDDVAYLQTVATKLRSKITALPTTLPGYSFIHGDLIPSNILIQADGSLALIDFDFCGIGLRAFDVATYLNELRFWEAAPELAGIFVEAYQEVRPLAAWELAALPALEAARTIFALGIPARHVNEWGNAYLSERMVATMLNQIQQSMRQIDIEG